MVTLSEVVARADAWLQPAQYKDYDRAWNGLQVENAGSVTHIAAAVDASLTTVQKAIDAGADLLIVHHGLFWSETRPWTGRRYALMKRLVEKGLAVYSQHLPLDGHPCLGNAAQLASALGWTAHQPFFFRAGTAIGVQSTQAEPVSRDELGRRLTDCREGRQNVGELAFVPEVLVPNSRKLSVREWIHSSLEKDLTGAMPWRKNWD